jgi:hypothetical protein
MRATLLALIMALGLAFAPPAAKPEGATDELQAQAAQIIADADAAVFFVPESAPPAVAARHVASGMLCRLGGSSRPGNIQIISGEAQGIRPGENVSCTSHVGPGIVTLYATRYPEAPTLEQAFGGAVGALRQAHPTAELIDPSTLQWITLGDRPPPPPSATAAFRVNINGQEAFTRVSVYVADGWTYKLRFTSPSPTENYIADIFWIMTLTELAPSAARAL